MHILQDLHYFAYYAYFHLWGSKGACPFICIIFIYGVQKGLAPLFVLFSFMGFKRGLPLYFALFVYFWIGFQKRARTFME
jgi:hypothetical protein